MRIALQLLLLLPTSLALAADHWPQFRGPGGQGHAARDAHVPLHWSESDHVTWKTRIPGRGWSSPVVYDDQIWMTTAIEHAASDQDRERRLAGNSMAHALEVAARITLRAVSVYRETGKILHDVELGTVEYPEPINTLNSYASPTPVVEADRVYCHFGAYGTWCVNTNSGTIVWHRELAIKHLVGPGSSPVLVEDRLVLVCDGADQQYIAALDKRSGKTVWKTPRPPIRAEDGHMRKAYCTPLLVYAAGRTQMIIPGAQWVIAYGPLTGEEIWRVDHGSGFSNVPCPVFDEGLVFICTGFIRPQLWAIRVDGQGDVTETHVTWREAKQIPTKPSPVLVDGLLYVMHDRGVATCFDAQSGETVWRERISGNYSASPLFAAGRIYVFSHEGKTTVFQPGHEYHALAENQIDGRIMATPAVADAALFLRSDTHLYRLETP